MDHPSVLLTVRRIAITTSVFVLFTTVTELGVLLLRPDLYRGRPKDLSALGRAFKPRYDFIVVGGGSAGSVVASRLSEVGGWSVLLLEAGIPETPISDIPGLAPSLLRSPADWQYLVEHNGNFCLAMEQQRCYWPAGKVLGGTSTLNGMLYVRGNRRDYDNWAALGNTGWDYSNVLQYFKKSEDMRVDKHKRDTTYHSTGGYLTLDQYRYRTPIADVFLEAGRELGYDIIDHNAENQRGFVKLYGTIRDGFRCNTAKAFLRPAKDRRNLDISLNSEVERVLIDPNTTQAYGVVFTKQGRKYTVLADKEVIISAGAVGSPKLLLLSGVGPREHLQDMQITPVISDLQVGHNLQDHIALGGLVYTVNQPIGIVLPRALSLYNFLDFFLNSGGPVMTTGVGETFAFVNTIYSPDPDWPDTALYLTTVPENVDGGIYLKRLLGLTDEFFNAVYEPIIYRDSFASYGTLMHPRSRGLVKLRSKDPKLPPVILPNYLSDELDVKVLVEAAKFGQSLSNTQVFKKYGATINPNPFPGCEHLLFMSDPYLECALRRHTMSLWHYAGTCKMGPDDDPEAVVDPRLRVRGVRGLRVADTSIIPVIPTANTNAAAIMIGEKVSDMIKEDWGEKIR